MKLSAEHYKPQLAVRKLKKTATAAWAAGSLLVLVWILLIVFAPFASSNGLTGISQPIYSFFGYLCHQMPSRSFGFDSHAFAVCSRCFGVYFGLLAGFLIYPMFRLIDETEPLPRKWLFLSLVPIGVDWSLGVFGFWENTHLSRFITGMILGAVCAAFIVPALVEIFQLRSEKTQLKRLSH